MIAGRVHASKIRAMFWCALFAAIASIDAPLSVLAQTPTISRTAMRAPRPFDQNEAVAGFDVVEAR
jgi:hypothetical protein